MALNHFHKYLYHEILRILIYEMKQGEASLGGAASASRWTSVLPLLRSTVATWAQDKERFGEVSGFVGVMPSWDLEAANMDAWVGRAGPCRETQAGLTKALPWQVEEGMSALIPQPGMATRPEPMGPPHSSEGQDQLCEKQKRRWSPSWSPEMPALQLREGLWQTLKCYRTPLFPGGKVQSPGGAPSGGLGEVGLLALSLPWLSPTAENTGRPKAQPRAGSKCHKPLSSLPAVSVLINHRIRIYSHP